MENSNQIKSKFSLDSVKDSGTRGVIGNFFEFLKSLETAYTAFTTPPDNDGHKGKGKPVPGAQKPDDFDQKINYNHISEDESKKALKDLFAYANKIYKEMYEV